MTHEPLWLLEWYWHRCLGANLRQLVRGHLRGRARLHLAGERGRKGRREGAVGTSLWGAGRGGRRGVAVHQLRHS